mmetsp:Transcript_690/g.1218  ORF Transcript_690/g.1218 Transcript_690/m.1218 type:complete len:203 (-) Transcript_690:826-1434(-)
MTPAAFLRLRSSSFSSACLTVRAFSRSGSTNFEIIFGMNIRNRRFFLISPSLFLPASSSQVGIFRSSSPTSRIRTRSKTFSILSAIILVIFSYPARSNFLLEEQWLKSNLNIYLASSKSWADSSLIWLSTVLRCIRSTFNDNWHSRLDSMRFFCSNSWLSLKLFTCPPRRSLMPLNFSSRLTSSVRVFVNLSTVTLSCLLRN